MSSPSIQPSTSGQSQFSDFDAALMQHTSSAHFGLPNLDSKALFKEAMQRRIVQGDITTADVDALKSAAKWPGICSFAGLGAGIPIWRTMSRPTPLAPLGMPFGLKLMTAGMSGLLGSTLGLLIGGMVASWRASANMSGDSRRKMQTFQEIEFDARRAFHERAVGVPEGTIVVHRAGVPAQTRYLTPDEARQALADLTKGQ